MKFLLRLLWAQNSFVNNQTHKPSPSSCMVLFTTSQTAFHIQKLPHPFRLTQNDVSIYFASFLKWHFHALTLRKLYKKPSNIINIRSSKAERAKKFYNSFLVFLNTTLFALLSPVQEITTFFAPVPAIKLPLLPKSCVHMFISLFSEIFGHKMNKLK